MVAWKVEALKYHSRASLAPHILTTVYLVSQSWTTTHGPDLQGHVRGVSQLLGNKRPHATWSWAHGGTDAATSAGLLHSELVARDADRDRMHQNCVARSLLCLFFPAPLLGQFRIWWSLYLCGYTAFE